MFNPIIESITATVGGATVSPTAIPDITYITTTGTNGKANGIMPNGNYDGQIRNLIAISLSSTSVYDLSSSTSNVVDATGNVIDRIRFLNTGQTVKLIWSTVTSRWYLYGGTNAELLKSASTITLIDTISPGTSLNRADWYYTNFATDSSIFYFNSTGQYLSGTQIITGSNARAQAYNFRVPFAPRIRTNFSVQFDINSTPLALLYGSFCIYGTTSGYLTTGFPPANTIYINFSTSVGSNIALNGTVTSPVTALAPNTPRRFWLDYNHATTTLTLFSAISPFTKGSALVTIVSNPWVSIWNTAVENKYIGFITTQQGAGGGTYTMSNLLFTYDSI
jgi:hypothetical protein